MQHSSKELKGTLQILNCTYGSALLLAIETVRLASDLQDRLLVVVLSSLVVLKDLHHVPS
eukprot:6477034-Amphidinium_carterae.1